MTPRHLIPSAALHALLFVAIAFPSRRAPRIERTLQPGTALGNTVLTYYAPGSSSPDGGTKPRPVRNPNSKATLEAPTAADKPGLLVANHGTGSSQESGLGQGDITIALGTYFPRPEPSLVTMQPGSAGDIVLDALIGEDGHIQKLTIIKSLGEAIDRTVLATVQTWTYTPAKRNGMPVPSEQEISFHFEHA